jgi:hypothetical protein
MEKRPGKGTRSRGRPPSPEHLRKGERVTIRLTSAEGQELARLAGRWGVTPVEALRRCLRMTTGMETKNGKT